MKLEDQVCSLDLAKRLKELGVKQESVFWWRGDRTEPQWYVAHERGPVYDVRYAAFTVAELADRLGFATGKNILRAYGHVFNVPDTHVITASGLQQCMTSPDIAAKMLIYLIENKLITV